MSQEGYQSPAVKTSADTREDGVFLRHSCNGGWSAAQERIHCYLSNGDPVQRRMPKPSVRFENLRNSSAEKMSLLRRNP
ncbi:hypothetical protein INR49_005429 [Caranx melampygus]|nr:hypothetical protein INR49_005429 [Caranx melampygus]